MLKVSVHAGPAKTASRFNLVAWLDIGYDKLAPIADYKTVLFQTGTGATLPASIYQYPRWSASLWDLTARALTLGLRVDLDCLNEELPPVVHVKKHFAFANQICALIEHTSSTGQHRRTLASVEINQVGRARGTYRARFEEHTLTPHVTEPFEFCPDYLRPAELLLHACAVRLTGLQELPPRPALCAPSTIEKQGRHYVPIHRLVEPARTGFLHWLNDNEVELEPHASARLGIVEESLYMKFLTEAV